MMDLTVVIDGNVENWLPVELDGPLYRSDFSEMRTAE